MSATITTTNTKELREKGQALFNKAHTFREEAPKNENGAMSAEDHATAIQMMADSKQFFDQAEAIDAGTHMSMEEKLESGELNISASDLADIQNDRWNKPISVAMGPNGTMIDINPNKPMESLLATSLPKEVLEASLKQVNQVTFSKSYHQDFMDYITRPTGSMGNRPTSLQEKASGAFQSICNPIRFSATVLDYCREMLWMRQLSTTITVLDSCSLGITREVKTASSAAWGDACKEPPACETPAFKLKTLSPEFMAYCACICRVLLNQRCVIDIEGFIARKLARDSAELEEQAYFWGDGKKKPLGLFYDPANPDDYCGADESNDYEGDCFGPCGIDWSFFVKAYMELPECTRNNPGSLAWVFNKNIICQMMLMCDGNGRPLWLNSLEGGLPSRFLNIPVRESAYAPDKFEAGKFWGVLGDFSGYYIADGLDQTTEREDDIKKNEACWVGRRATDGMIVDPEKFVRLKCSETEVVTEG